MQDVDVPVILCSEEEKRERLCLRKKVAAMERAATARPQRPQKPVVKKLIKTITHGQAIDIEEADIELPNPYKITSREYKKPCKGYDAPTHRWSLVTGLKKRNKVADIPDNTRKSTKDEEFLQLIQGRPIKNKLVRKQYVDQMKQRLMNNVLSGFIRDEIKSKEENSITMQVAIDKAQQEIDNASKAMADFLSEEQRTCENMTNELKNVVKERERKEIMLENEKQRMSEVKLQIFKQSEQLETMRKCRDFVLHIAPKEWREQHSLETEKRQKDVKEESDKLREAVDHFKKYCGGEDPGLEEVLEDFFKEFSTAGPPTLPFSDPKMVFDLFKDLEMKSQMALHNNAILREKVEKSKSICESYDKYLKNEKGAIDDMLNEIKQSIEKEEKKIKQKKQQLQDLLDGPFKKLVASDEILKEYAIIKDVYEEVIDQPKEGLSTLEMVQEIGELYIELNRNLETLPDSKRKYLKNKVKRELENEMNKAEKAQQRKKQVQNMVKGLQRAREKPWKPIGRPLLFRSPKDGDEILKRDIHSEGTTKDKASKKQEEPEEEPEDALPLVWASNHPGPGPHRRVTRHEPQHDHKNFYPDIQLYDTEESEELLSETEDEQDKKVGKPPIAKEEKKIKKKKRVRIVISDSDS